ncbi:ATP-NAD kinase family protein [Alishewanella sp. SMS8]|uniref:ATP-NAD kinase family protein n=1 Tax=unclassified Alishewanella TaxID=2628974 RepID=UPI0027408762|nr:ATP-NAD kinase family protein [Alishewanella sp. SMS8]MDP5185732.1 ATP-NAD kinase family protein [Alishewanella sp.]MDP5458108.1 ATP-NAD kinase family protein [Alishewanella sp. SMS8]
MAKRFRLGLIINPLAGLGGSVGLKGSDQLAEQALALGATPMAGERARVCLEQLLPLQQQVEILTVAADMGEALAAELGFQYQVCYTPTQHPTQALDTEHAAELIAAAGVDLLLFAGGDGTARNVCSVVADRTTVLGIPAGCKIHSGVYAISPLAAGKLLSKLVAGELVSQQEAAVMDIDEVAFRQGVVKARRYGEMRIPAELRYVQSVKMAGKESAELVLDDLAAYVASQLEDNVRYVMGSGSTVAAVMAELGLENTLLGVDVVENGQLLAQDVTASELLDWVKDYPSKLVITLIGGQGHVFGRGNQQLSPAVIRAVGRDNILLLATKTKLQQLDGRPLLADTGDVALDRELQGLISVLTGYNDYVIYRLGYEDEH